MTNKRKIKRLRAMQAEIRKNVKDNNKYLYFDPITCTYFFVSKHTLLRLKVFANALSCIHESYDEYKERIKKEFGGS